MMCFFHISHFGPWICCGTRLTNTNTKMNKTSQLNRAINKITEGLGAVLYNWFHMFVTYNSDQKATVLDRLLQGNSTFPSDDWGKKTLRPNKWLGLPCTFFCFARLRAWIPFSWGEDAVKERIDWALVLLCSLCNPMKKDEKNFTEVWSSQEGISVKYVAVSSIACVQSGFCKW